MFGIIEITPVFAGCLSFFLLLRSSARRGDRWALLMVFVAAGVATSWLAGEWAEAIVPALLAMLWDSAKAATGYVLARYAFGRWHHRIA